MKKEIDFNPTPKPPKLIELEKLKVQHQEFVRAGYSKNYFEELKQEFLKQQKPGRDFPKPPVENPLSFSEHNIKVTSLSSIKTYLPSEKGLTVLTKSNKCIHGINFNQVTPSENPTLEAPISLTETTNEVNV